MTDHRHLIQKPHPPYLCECGARWDVGKDRWLEPKTAEERRLRAAWEEA